ncbi:MAG: choice-of-anchor D domain-containing protein [Bacteroidetes bacterium]|nr:choice-of-anchor D domain-containing protein [Bacteroidota bacterium]
MAVSLFTLVCALLLPTGAHAQGSDPQLDDNAAGTYYLIAYPDTTTNQLDSRYPNNRVRPEASLWIFSAVKNKVKITGNGGASAVLNLEAGKFKTYSLAAGAVVDVSNSVSRNTFKVESDYPIILYCYFAHIQAVEAWTPIPVEEWGTNYVVAGIPGEIVNEIGIAGETEVPSTPKPGAGEALVIAAYDNTHVSFIPGNGILRGFEGGTPSTVTLNEGEAYQVQTKVDTSSEADKQDDIGGTLILADKPVGVISGNTRVQVVYDNVGLKNNAYKNSIIEWLPPAEQFGKEFEFMPTWDNHRPGIGSDAERLREFVRVYNASGKAIKGYYYSPGGTTQVKVNVKPSDFQEIALGQPQAVSFHMEQPAMAMMHSSAIVKFEGSSPCFRGIPCTDWSAWAPYMTEMTPREQWPSFAPYYAPTNPGNMSHYINVVTDTLSAQNIIRENGATFPFTRRIPGTDLVWGSMAVSPGEDHWLMGKNGAKFAGHVYGLMQGAEAYRPGLIKKKDDGGSVILGGGSKDPIIQHPCEYEEYNAVSYGYPLAPTRRVLLPPDTLKIDTTMDCFKLTIKIAAINQNPVGLRSITLDPSTVKNAKLNPVDPVRLSDILGRSACTIEVEAIDPLQDADAVVIIKDRTGKIWRVVFHYEAEHLTVNPSGLLDFGTVNLGGTLSKTITITNPLTRDIQVKDIRLALGLRQYKILSTTPGPVPGVLKPGDTWTITVQVSPDEDNQEYDDTVKCILGCVTVPVPLKTQTSKPCIYVGDLNFGQFIVNNTPASTLPLKITNNGSGPLVFKDPVVTFADTHFSVAQTEKDKLKASPLLPNQSITISVTFTPGIDVAQYRTVATFYTNASCDRDTSVWTANVVKPGVLMPDHSWIEWVTTLNSCTKNSVASYQFDIPVTNAGNVDATVKSIQLLDDPGSTDATDKYFTLETADQTVMVRPGDLILQGGTVQKVQRVYFSPKDERNYSCRMLLTTETGDSIYSQLNGTGIESHGKITGWNFDTTLYKGPYPATPSQRTTIMLHALPTRPLTVNDVQITGVDAGNYWIDRSIAPVSGMPGTPVTVQPGDSIPVTVEYRPVQAGSRKADLVFIGDQSRCDGKDTVGPLAAYSFTRGVMVTDLNFGNVLSSCQHPDSSVTITNTGTEAVVVVSATLDDTDKSGFFSADFSNVLDTLYPGQTKTVKVNFSPRRVGTFHAQIVYEVVSAKDGQPVPSVPSQLVGTGYIVTVHAKVQDTPALHGAPGSFLDAPIILQDPLDDAGITSFIIGVYYNNKIEKLTNGTNDPRDLASMLNGTIVSGWTITIIESDFAEGYYIAALTAPPGRHLTGTGKLLNPNFQLFLGTDRQSKITFYVLPPSTQQCARILPTPGLITVDSVCGLNLRLIESTGFGYSLNQNKPNPFNPSTDITFSLGLDGPTKLTVYDASGKKVATLVDGMMQPGLYQVTWDATGFPSGLYYYRLESGDWTHTSTMIMRK